MSSWESLLTHETTHENSTRVLWESQDYHQNFMRISWGEHVSWESPLVSHETSHETIQPCPNNNVRATSQNDTRSREHTLSCCDALHTIHSYFPHTKHTTYVGSDVCARARAPRPSPLTGSSGKSALELVWWRRSWCTHGGQGHGDYDAIRPLLLSSWLSGQYYCGPISSSSEGGRREVCWVHDFQKMASVMEMIVVRVWCVQFESVPDSLRSKKVKETFREIRDLHKLSESRTCMQLKKYMYVYIICSPHKQAKRMSRWNIWNT